MLTIDGSAGEGGGQILRSALALSVATGTPFRIEQIRVRRPKPGLLRQHLAAVNAAAAISGADVSGAQLRSQEITFRPRSISPGKYTFAVGSAGSTGLVLQTVLPPLLTAPGPSQLTLEGGTHNPFAPPFDFLAKAFLPLLGRMGVSIEARLERYGFYPAGGGRCTVRIQPAARLARLELLDRGPVRATRGRALVANLPQHIAERELKVIRERLGWDPADLTPEVITDAAGPGNAVVLEIECEHVTEVFTGFGERRVHAEVVAERVAEEARRYLAAGVPVGEHLADQLLVPLALAGGGAFRTVAWSRHSTTNADVIRRFLGVEVTTTTVVPDDVIVEVRPCSAPMSSA